MVKLSPEEFKEIAQEAEHEKVLAALESVRLATVRIGRQIEAQVQGILATLERHQGTTAGSSQNGNGHKNHLTQDDLVLIMEKVNALEAVPKPAPTSFKVQRGKDGLIDRIVVEN